MWRMTAVAFLVLMVLAASGCGGGGSAAQTPQPPQSPPPPTVAGASITISPTSATAGSSDLKLTITGSNFTGDHHNFSQAGWSVNSNNTELATTFVSSTQLTSVIPAALLSSPVTAQLFVQTGDPMGDLPLAKSNSVSFSVTSANPATASLSPTLATLGPNGTQQFVAIMNGKNADAMWAVEEGAVGGSVTSTGLYTVPAHLGTFHVIATIVADPAKNAAATVSVVASGFTPTGNMSSARSGHSATLLADGRVLVVGGADASAELFDPTTGTFTPTGSMTTTRFGPTATLLANGKVLIAGGFGPGVSSLPRLSSAELYDSLTGTFSATGSMTAAREMHTATLLNDGKVLIAGGTRDGGGGGAALASAELYDPATGKFTLTGSMLSDRAQHTATLLASGKVLIAGGWNGHRADAPDDPPWDPLFAELFDSSTGAFKSTGSMSTTRIGHKAVRLSDGMVLMLGGIWALQNIHQQPPAPTYAELYDPATGAFSPGGNIILSQDSYTATLLTNGQVLIAGGEKANIAVAPAELIDVANGSLVTTGSLVTARKGHTATRLSDGRVLVTGGTDRNGNALATAELYK